jgi:hypothetical protein
MDHPDVKALMPTVEPLPVGYVDLSDDLLLQILTGLEFGHAPRMFRVIEDAIPHGSRVVRAEYVNERRTVRIHFQHPGAEARQYTPTLQTVIEDRPVEAVVADRPGGGSEVSGGR